jgi:predicted nucleic acid-binding protein
MQRVVDASVAAKWFLPEPHKDKAEKLLRDFLTDKVDLIAPDLIVAEVGNVLWHRSILRGDISATQASESFANFLAIPLTLQPSSTIAVAAFTLAAETRHRIYDMLYVALAQQKGCELVTADEKLVNKLSGTFPFVRWVGDL